MTNTNTAIGAELITAAQAVVDRWDTPLWKDVPATAEYIGRLRAALASAAAPAEQPVYAHARNAIMDAAYDFRDAHISGCADKKRFAQAALECAIGQVMSTLTAPRGQAPAQAAPAAVASPGWKLVPVEPTPEMLSEIWVHKNGSLSEAYRAMLAAAPQPVVREPLTDEAARKQGANHD